MLEDRLLDASDGDCRVRARSGPEARAARSATAATTATTAAATATTAGATGPKDHVGNQGTVRLRQGGAEAGRQGRDRQRSHFQAPHRVQARVGAGDRTHRSYRYASLQPEALRASRQCGA